MLGYILCGDTTQVLCFVIIFPILSCLLTLRSIKSVFALRVVPLKLFLTPKSQRRPAVLHVDLVVHLSRLGLGSTFVCN